MVDPTFRPLLSPCLSLHQPWAWLVVNGFKTIENRPNLFKCLRGRWILIHATTLNGPRLEAETIRARDHIRAHFAPDVASALIDELRRAVTIPQGGIVGRAFVAELLNHSESPWWIGPKAYELKDAAPLPFIACPGKQGLWYTEKAQAIP